METSIPPRRIPWRMIAGLAVVGLYAGWWLWSRAFLTSDVPGVPPLHLAWSDSRIAVVPVACLGGALMILVSLLSGLRIFKPYLPAALAFVVISLLLVGGLLYPYDRWMALDARSEGGHSYRLLGYSTGDIGQIALYECGDAGLWCHRVYAYENQVTPDLEGKYALLEGPAVQYCEDASSCGVVFTYEP